MVMLLFYNINKLYFIYCIHLKFLWIISKLKAREIYVARIMDGTIRMIYIV